MMAVPWFPSSPLYYKGYLYVLTYHGVLLVYDCKKDSLVYKKLLDLNQFEDARRDRIYAEGECASISVAGDMIFVQGSAGTMYVLKPGPTFDVLSRNRIETAMKIKWWTCNEGIQSNPFFDGKNIYIRAERYMYCVGAP